jgi:alanyl-tRNA synthetase
MLLFLKCSATGRWVIISKKIHGLGIDPRKIYISVFAGDKDSPRDNDSIAIWKEVYAKVGIDARVFGEEDLEVKNKSPKPTYRIFLLGKEDNWWPTGGKHPGPQGPDTEIFYYWGKGEPDPKKERPGFNDDNFWEVWNNVFMEYNRKDGGFSPLAQKNVDTGMGLERIASALQGKQDVFQSDLYAPIIKILEYESNQKYGKDLGITRAMRIIADHLRTAVFILGDDAHIMPSNLGKGYVLRRLIRRSLRYQKMLEIDGENKNFLEQLARTIVENYAEAYPELGRNFNYILEELKSEQERFEKTLEKGLKEWEKIASQGKISGEEAFNLFSTYGFPLELTEELAQENKILVDKAGFQQAFEKHQKISRDGADKRFKGGLIDDSYETTKLHTATHLMQAALRAVLGPDIAQKGSNITPDRLRFDFCCPQKLTEEEKKRVEELVNNVIQSRLPIEISEMKYEKAIQSGAIGVYEKKNGEKVKVFTIGSPGQPFSREICGGPHVKNTSELGKFRIIKEEAISAGVRRIKAILE